MFKQHLLGMFNDPKYSIFYSIIYLVEACIQDAIMTVIMTITTTIIIFVIIESHMYGRENPSCIENMTAKLVKVET